MGQITKVTPDMIQVANNVTSTTIGNTTSGVSLTFDSNGVITSAANVVLSVANTQLTGTITATQMAANSVNSTILQTNSVENYMAISGRPLSNRNLIINGAMQIAQRNTSVTGITTGGYYTADRWIIGISSAGTWTMNVESSGPANTEFRKSANVICTTANSSLGSNEQFRLLQRIEGQNLQSIKKGTSAAESLTISFYVKSSNTGTYICEFFDNDNTRQISKSYTIDAADTWEKKTITVPPDTTGQFDNDNANSFQLSFWLAAGTDFTSGTLNSSAWASNVTANRLVGQLNLANAVGNYWAVTGIQLETGTVATPYEWLDYGVELAKCQRYYEKMDTTDSLPFIGQAYSTTAIQASMTWKVTKRAAPTIAFSGTSTIYNSTGSGNAATLTYAGISTDVAYINGTTTGLTAGNAALIYTTGTSFFSFSAEL
jgi:hypothetical protein